MLEGFKEALPEAGRTARFFSVPLDEYLEMLTGMVWGWFGDATACGGGLAGKYEVDEVRVSELGRGVGEMRTRVSRYAGAPLCPADWMCEIRLLSFGTIILFPTIGRPE